MTKHQISVTLFVLCIWFAGLMSGYLIGVLASAYHWLGL